MKKVCLFITVLLLLSCEILPSEPSLNRAAPEYLGPPIIDFDYDNSPNFTGYIRFYNKSKGISSYLWSFGFKQPDGNTLTLHAISPRVKFPSNGTYTIVLSGTGNDNQTYTVSRSIVVTNN
jgi:hypothetical protein